MSRRGRRLTVVAVATLVGVGGVFALALAQPAGGCTITGTNKRDLIAGTDGSDFICLRGGKDYGHGRDGPDVVRGGRRADALVGGDGPDRILGKRGDDQLFSVDGQGGDEVNGGRGFDRCYGEHGDRFARCERVFRGGSPYPKPIVMALSHALGGAIDLGGSYQDRYLTLKIQVDIVCGQPSPPPLLCDPVPVHDGEHDQGH